MGGVRSLTQGGFQVWFTAYGICEGRQGPEGLKVGMNGKMKWWRNLEVWALEEEMQALVDETQKLQKGTEHCNSLKFCLHSEKYHF